MVPPLFSLPNIPSSVTVRQALLSSLTVDTGSSYSLSKALARRWPRLRARSTCIAPPSSHRLSADATGTACQSGQSPVPMRQNAWAEAPPRSVVHAKCHSFSCCSSKGVSVGTVLRDLQPRSLSLATGASTPLSFSSLTCIALHISHYCNEGFFLPSTFVL